MKKNIKNKPSNNKINKKSILFLLLLCALGLMLSKLIPSTQDNSAEQAVKIEIKEETKPVMPQVIPPKPQEEWEYINSLPNREIKVIAKENIAPTKGYVMQCGAYKTLAQAESRKKAIALEGLSSEIKHTSDSVWYRVTLGPFALKRDAERVRHKLQRAQIDPCAIWIDN